MISFRFHVVSITAVFLGLAIGVVIGSTYVDRAIVNRLNARIETVSRNLDERKAANDELERQLGESEAAIASSLDFAATDRLVDVPVLVLAARGVDEEAVAETITLARHAGGVVPGVVWIEPKWSLEGDGDRDVLADLVGAPASASEETVVREVWDALAEELVLIEGEAAGETTTTTEPAAGSTDVLDGLIEDGFLSLDAVGDDAVRVGELAGTGARALVITGTEANDATAPVVPVAVDAVLAADLDAVVADVFVSTPDGPERAEAVTEAIPEDVRDALALVDDAELPQGQLAAVLALDAIADDVVGHFGYGSGADGVLPPWSPL
jgi:hypothetical protein